MQETTRGKAEHRAARTLIARLAPMGGAILALAASVLFLAEPQPSRGAGIYTSPGTGQTLTPASLVTAGAMTALGTNSYALTQTLNISAGDSLHLSSGTTIKPAAGVEIRIYGRMEAVGTATAPIVLGDTAGATWDGVKIRGQARGCSLAWIQLMNIQGSALSVDITDTSTSSSFENITITDVTGTALDLASIPAAARHRFRDFRILRAGCGVKLTSCAGVMLETFAIGALNTSGAQRACIWIAQGGAACAILDGTFSGPGLIAGPRGVSEPNADSLLVLRSTFSGSANETGIELRFANRVRISDVTLSGYAVGISADRCAGLAIANTTASSCGTAIRLLGAPRFAEATPEPFGGWLELAQSGGGRSNWDNDAGGNLLDRFPPAFTFPTPSIRADSIALFADGHLRLPASPTQYILMSSSTYEGKASILGNPTMPAIFALPDDLEPSSDTSALEGFGFRVFVPGDTDENGGVASETVAVCEWRAPTADDAATRANRVAVHLFPDGRIRWLFRELAALHVRHSFYAGAWLDSGRTEVLAVVNPRETTSAYTYTPGTTPVGGTAIESTTVAGSTTGIQADSAVRLLVRSSTLSGNGTAIAIGPGLESCVIAGSNIVASTTADIAVTATSGSVLVSGSYMPTSTVTGNPAAVTVSSPSSAPLLTSGAQASVVTSPKTCVLGRLLGGAGSSFRDVMALAREIREGLLESAAGRWLVRLYHWL